MIGIQDFKKTLDKITQDVDNTEKAYKLMNQTQSQHGRPNETQQRKFLNQYNKLNDSGIYPIEQKIGQSIYLTGVRYDHDGAIEDIDFNDPANIEYKKTFDHAYMEMTLSARTQTKYGELYIHKERGKNQYVISPRSEAAWYTDPLDPNTVGFTKFVSERIRQSRPGTSIAVETKRTMFTSNNPETNETDVYTTPEDIHSICCDRKRQWKKADKIASVKDGNVTDMPFDIIRLTMQQDNENAGTLKQMNRTMEPDELEYIREISLTDDKLNISSVRMEHDEKGTNRNKVFAMLKQYGRYAAYEVTGEQVLSRFGYDDPYMNHDQMIHDFEQLSRIVNQFTPADICNRANSEQVDTDNLDGIASSLMRAKKGDINYYPVYNMTGTSDVYKEPLALAAVDSKTWKLQGLLRMDDAEAAVIYDKMKDSIDRSINRTIQGSMEPFVIPENEITESMQNQSPDMQCE